MLSCTEIRDIVTPDSWLSPPSTLTLSSNDVHVWLAKLDSPDMHQRQMAQILNKDECTPCFAWTLIPNHLHMLLSTGSTPIATVMRRLLTGYAVTFNRRNRRHGQLFQNRYPS
jgi:hypothetical protein